LALLHDSDPAELKEVLLAISRSPGEVPAKVLLPFLQSTTPTVRAAAALALAVHQPNLAAGPIGDLLQRDERRSAHDYAAYVRRGKPKLTQAEIDPIVEEYREHMKLIHALELLPDSLALPALTAEAFRFAEDSSHVTSVLAGYGLWDRIAADPAAALAALGSPAVEVADRAEWMLVKADPSVLPNVRNALSSATPAVRARLIHILAWQGDTAALPNLQESKRDHPAEAAAIDWAMQKIELLRFASEDTPSRAK
jgi:glycerophosphoryl diester phosphodiesterase